MSTEDVIYGSDKSRHPPKDGPTLDLDVIGKQVGAWCLRQDDNWGKLLTPGAHPQTSYNAIEPIAKYICAHPEIPVNEAGFEQAYQACLAAGIIDGASGPKVEPTVLAGRKLIALATDADFFYCYKLQVLTGRDIAEILAKAFSGPSDVIGFKFNQAVNDHQVDASAFNLSDYSGELQGI